MMLQKRHEAAHRFSCLRAASAHVPSGLYAGRKKRMCPILKARERRNAGNPESISGVEG